MKKGFIFVIEGSDCSGKETISREVFNDLKRLNKKVHLINYPRYDSKWCEGVKSYLNGEFGDNANCLNPYQASSLFAMDRLTDYIANWKHLYENGEILIFDRFVSSNIVHQASKIEDLKERNEFIFYWNDFEHNKLSIPTPNKVFFLDMPPLYSQILNENRKNKITGEDKKDIHEKDISFLEKSYLNAKIVSVSLGWEEVKSVGKENKKTIEDIRSIEEIKNEVLNTILSIIE